jgi:hypothetical protein
MSLVTTRQVLYFDPRVALQDTRTGALKGDAHKRLNDLVDRTGGENADYLPIKSKTVAELQAITPDGPAIALCSNETGGATLVFWEGAAWRRVADRAVIS